MDGALLARVCRVKGCTILTLSIDSHSTPSIDSVPRKDRTSDVARMSGTFRAAMAERELDQRLPALSSEYASLAALMPPLVRALIVNNAEPWTVGAQAVLDELKLGGWYADEEDAAALEYIPGLLSASQCAAVRAALEAAEEAEEGGEWCKRDSVDEALDYQLNITKDGLLALVGPEAVALLWAHAGRCHTAMNPGAHLPGLSLGATALPEVHEIFIRYLTAATRIWNPPICRSADPVVASFALSEGTLRPRGHGLASMSTDRSSRSTSRCPTTRRIAAAACSRSTTASYRSCRAAREARPSTPLGCSTRCPACTAARATRSSSSSAASARGHPNTRWFGATPTAYVDCTPTMAGTTTATAATVRALTLGGRACCTAPRAASSTCATRVRRATCRRGRNAISR